MRPWTAAAKDRGWGCTAGAPRPENTRVQTADGTASNNSPTRHAANQLITFCVRRGLQRVVGESAGHQLPDLYP